MRRLRFGLPYGALTEKGLIVQYAAHLSPRRWALLAVGDKQIASAGCLGLRYMHPRLPHNKSVKHTALSFLSDVEPVLTFDNLDGLIKNRAFGWRGKELCCETLR
jgi:hypothetical protein